MENIQVLFKASDEKYAISDAPILLPINVGKEGLLQIVHHFLDEDLRVPFEFAVNSVLLAEDSTIDQIIKENDLSTEQVLLVDYFPSMSKPSPQNTFEQDDWISSLCVKSSLLFTACYDYEVYVWDLETFQKITSKALHSSPIKCMDVMTSADGSILILTGALDNTIILSKYEEQRVKPLRKFTGNKNSVHVVKFSPSGDFFASGSFDGSVCLYNLNDSEDTPVKKRKLEIDNVPVVNTPVYAFSTHKECITGIVFIDEENLLISSLDKQLSLFDLKSRTNTLSVSNDSAVLSMDYKHGLVVAGNSENSLSIYSADGKKDIFS
jgi:ribosome biogenesis protein YTM1